MTKASRAGGTRKGMREAQTRAREWKKSREIGKGRKEEEDEEEDEEEKEDEEDEEEAPAG